MSIFLLGILSGIGAGYLSGGCLRSLGALRLPSGLLVIVWFALAMQVALRWIPGRIEGLGATSVFLIATYGAVAAALGVYLVGLSRTSSSGGMRAGVVLIAVGWLLNFVVIALNRGMPFSGTASGHTELFLKHVSTSSDTKLRFLGDVIHLRPFHEIVSAGDLVLTIGLALYVCAAMKSVREPALLLASGQSEG
jgi:Family of unknown function (DUF5317)